MFAWARKRVSRRAKCPATNQSLCGISSQRHAAEQTPNTWAGQCQLRQRLLPAGNGSGRVERGWDLEAEDTYALKRDRRESGICAQAVPTAGVGPRRVCVSNRVTAMCPRGHCEPLLC